MTTPGNVLEVEHLDLRFGNKQVLSDLSFSLREHSALAVIGPNGAGKTVLFQALIGSLPHGGDIRWAKGIRIGYVPQKLDIERDLPITGMDFLRAKVSLAKGECAEVERVLALVGLSHDSARQRIGTLSGGQFQRLLLAFALLGRPSVLLFDEPTAGLDEPGEEILYERIHRLASEQDLTLLLISHELSVVYRYADTVLCLGHGRPYQGPPKEILTPHLIAEIYGAPMKYHHHDPDA